MEHAVDKKQTDSITLDESPVQKLEENDMKKVNMRTIVVVYIILVLLGVGTGFLLSKKTASSIAQSGNSPTIVKTGKVVGSTDTTTFKDSADGVIQKGGLDGEGSHQLIRAGGPSQTAYLISSVVDLDQYVGKRVRVWGQTIAAKKVSWLMDVGRVEVLSE